MNETANKDIMRETQTVNDDKVYKDKMKMSQTDILLNVTQTERIKSYKDIKDKTDLKI